MTQDAAGKHSPERAHARAMLIRGLRQKKPRENFVGHSFDVVAEYQDTQDPAVLIRYAESLWMTARMRATPGYIEAVRKADRHDRLVRWHLRKVRPGRPFEEIFNEANRRRVEAGNPPLLRPSAAASRRLEKP